MRVLVVHNEYGKRSGEEAVVELMEGLFRDLGCEVDRLRMSTAGVRDSLGGKVRAFVSGIYCPSGVRAMREALRRFRPDVVNVHNLYPFISPAALRECRKAGVKVIMTVHNYRLACPTGLFMRDGGPCELCLERGDEWGCVRHNCEGSRLKSVAYAARNMVARVKRHYLDCVDLFACITEFQRGKLIEAGVPAERTLVIPNGILLDCWGNGSNGADKTNKANGADKANGGGPASSGRYVGYVGRLSAEKGIDLILEAARCNPDIPFRLAGAVAVEGLVDNLPENVELVGFVSGKELDDFYAGARFMVMASRWYEGFPMSILESGAHGRGVIGPRHGGFVEVISQGDDSRRIGELFTPGDVGELSAAVRGLWDDPGLCDLLGARALAAVRERYSLGVVREMWRKAIKHCDLL